MNITEISGQKAIPVIVQRVEPSDFNVITEKQFFFNWDQLKGEAKEALRKYDRLACISLTPKTEIRQHYISKYGMKTAGQQVYAESEALGELIKLYDI